MPEPQDEATLQGVSESVQELHKTIEKSTALLPTAEQKEMFEKLEPHFAAFDKANEKATQAEKDAIELKNEMASLTEKLELKETDAKSMAEQMETLQAAVDRRQSARKEEDPNAWKDEDHFKALTQWFKGGRSAVDAELKAGLLRTDENVSGGFMAGPQFDTRLLELVTELNQMRGLARVERIDRESLDIVVRDTLPVAQYVGQAEAGPVDASKFITNNVRPIRVTLQTGATQQVLSHTAYDMDSQMSKDAAIGFAVAEGTGNVLGTGSGEPEGFLAAGTGIERIPSTATAAGTIDGDDIINLQGEIKDGYDSRLLFNRKTLAALRTLRAGTAAVGDGGGAYLWDPNLNGPATGEIAGMPYSIMPSMPNLANDSESVAMGDWFRSFIIVDTIGLMMVRDELTEALRNIILLTWHRFNTSQVVIPEGIKILTTKGA